MNRTGRRSPHAAETNHWAVVGALALNVEYTRKYGFDAGAAAKIEGDVGRGSATQRVPRSAAGQRASAGAASSRRPTGGIGYAGHRCRPGARSAVVGAGPVGQVGGEHRHGHRRGPVQHGPVCDQDVGAARQQRRERRPVARRGRQAFHAGAGLHAELLPLPRSHHHGQGRLQRHEGGGIRGWRRSSGAGTPASSSYR